MSDDEIEARKKAAERGWLVDPPPRPPRAMIPGEENKWYLMAGALHFSAGTGGSAASFT
jgi:hypothetical protein